MIDRAGTKCPRRRGPTSRLELISSLAACGHPGWYGADEPTLSIHITGSPLAVLRAVDSHSLERIGRDFNAIVSSSVFRSGFPGRPPISQAAIDAGGLLLMFDHQGGLLDPYFAQPAGVQCTLNQALALALAQVYQSGGHFPVECAFFGGFRSISSRKSLILGRSMAAGANVVP